MKHGLIVVALAALAASCATVHHSVQSEPNASGQKPPPKEGSAGGAIGEEEFKKLHELKEGAAPALHGRMIELAGTQAYLSLPPGATAPVPGIVVIHEWWGLNDHVKHWADRLAAAGYAALAVDLYGGVVAKNSDEALAAMKKVDDEAARKTLLAAHEFLARDARIKATKRGSIGWCFGGSKSLALALAAKDLDACVMYYGHPVLEPEKLAPLEAPLLGIFGARDASIPPETVAKFERALTDAGKTHTLLSYDAEHAFANPSSKRYDEKNAAAAWEKVRAFLARHLKGAK